MNKEEARSKVCEMLRESLGSKYDIVDVSIVEYPKNNGVHVEGVSVKVRDCNTVPCIYSVDFGMLDSEDKIRDILPGLCSTFDMAIKNVAQTFVPPEIDFESSRDRIILSLINYELNKEQLENCPHIIFNDLAITFRLSFSIEDSNSSTLITDSLASIWDKSTEDLWNIAVENSVRDLPVYIERLEDVMKQYCGCDPFCEPVLADNPFYILTNRRLYYGASSILYTDVPGDIYKNVGCNYFILPSSINELIIVPEDSCDDRNFLKGMVESVNKTLYSKMDYLSDSVYYYDHETNRIAIA